MVAREPGVMVRDIPGLALSENSQERSRIMRQQWPEHGLNALRVPYLGCVVEGEVDLRIGVTQRMLRLRPELADSAMRQVVTLPERSFFLVPPNVPIAGATRLPHWEREEPMTGRSRILWVHVMPSGVVTHFCTSLPGEHITHPFMFSRTQEMAQLVETIQAELSRPQRGSHDVAVAQLLVALIWIERGMAQGELKTLTKADDIEEAAVPLWQRTAGQTKNEGPLAVNHNSTAFERTCQYIANQPSRFLTADLLAEHAHVSASHLNRIFRHETGMSLMKYVSNFRLQKARTMLLNTTLTAAEIGDIAGFKYPSHFTQAFLREFGVTPQQFRKGVKASDPGDD